MSQIPAVIDVLKKALKSQNLTYAEVARHLGLSEVSVKRMFSRRHMTLARLESVCALVQLDFTDLVRLLDEERHRISSLTTAHEEELVSDLKFLLVAICVQNGWTYEEIVDYYDIAGPQCLHYLIRLDRLGLIQLLPNNRIRRMVAQDFRWLPRGPIERFFERHVQKEFLKSHFSRPGELRLYMAGMLSRRSLELMQGRIEMLAREFAALRQDDSRLPAKARLNSGVIFAMRSWELPAFARMRRRH